MTIKLNGWQRLWLLLVALSTLPLAAYIYYFIPRPSDINHENSFYREMKAASVSKLAGELTVLGFDEASKDVGIRIQMPNDHYLPFRNSATPEEIKAVSSEYFAILEHNTAIARKKFVSTSLAIWLVSNCFVYVMGFLIGWVIRGFKNE